MRTLTIAVNTLKEAIRQPVIILIIALFGGAVFFSQFITFFGLGEEARMLRDSCLATITIGGLLVAIFASASVISDEIEKKTAMTVLCKPVSRVEFILGKYFGILLALLVAYIIFSVVFLFTIWCNESPTVQGLFSLWWRNDRITDGHLARWMGERTKDPNHLASGGAVIVSLLRSARLFTVKLVPALLQALICSYAEVAVLAAAAVAASTRLSTVLNAVVSASFFVVGHLQGYLVRAFYPVDDLGQRMYQQVDSLSLGATLLQYPSIGIAKLFHAILPDLEMFSYSAQVAFQLPKFEEVAMEGVRDVVSPIPMSLMGETLLYGMLYSAALVLIAVISFRNRELT